MIETSITAPCRRDQVVDILTGAVLRLLATRAMKGTSQVPDELRPAPARAPLEPPSAQPQRGRS
jgi:hypothetical protein